MTYSDAAVSRAQEMVLREGLNHLASACFYIERVQSKTPDLTRGYCIVSDPELSGSLQNLAVHLGQASLILFDGTKRTSESAALTKVRSARVAQVRNHLTGIDTSSLEDRKVRNRLIHVDEYMAKAALRAETSWLTDLGLSHRDTFNFDQTGVNYCRVYVFAEQRLLHLGAELDVGAAHIAARAVLKRFDINRNVGERASSAYQSSGTI